MCFFKAPKIPEMPPPTTPPPPPPPPPAPGKTASGLTIGDRRQSAPIRTFLARALGAYKKRSSLVVGGADDDQTDTGLNIPR